MSDLCSLMGLSNKNDKPNIGHYVLTISHIKMELERKLTTPDICQVNFYLKKKGREKRKKEGAGIFNVLVSGAQASGGLWRLRTLVLQ